ncbi:MAG: SPOR domain-containing protein [Candidatus Omnitrophica bacterium]|nr:SPOR domain-containing protein [Candidatus Omnitrophota bacterium]
MVKVKVLMGFAFIFISTAAFGLSTAGADVVSVEKLFLEGRYERAVREADHAINERARQRDEIYYLKGISELRLARFKEARQSFDALISKYKKSARFFDAHIGIGDSYFLAGDTENAARIYNEIKAKFPSCGNIPLVNSRLEDCRKKGVPMTASAPTAIAVPAVITPSIAEKPDASGDAGPKKDISVQIGSFKNRRNAERLSAKVCAKGYDARVQLPVDAGDNLYRVRVGRLESKSEAEGLSAKLVSEGYRTKICDDSTCQ